MEEITPTEFKREWDAGRRPLLIDVRRPDEWDTVNLEEFGARLIPLSELQARVGEIPREADVVVQCKSGGRSAQAQRFLQAQGYARVQNLAGGINAWSEEVDPNKPLY